MIKKIYRAIPVLAFVPILPGVVSLSGGPGTIDTFHKAGSGVNDTIVAVREAVLPVHRKALPHEVRSGEKNASGYRIVAFGGSLTAGFQNGGLYREGQQWAYPHLIARQMGVPFTQPLFSKSKGNGTGYYLPSVKPDVPAGKRKVTNNLAISGPGGDLEPFSGADPDNYAVPFFGKRMMDSSGSLYLKARPFIRRIRSSSASDSHLSTQWAWLSSLDLRSDMFVFEAGFDDLVNSILTDGGGISQISFENLDHTDEMKLIKRLAENGKKGVLLNVPDVASLPYFQQYNRDLLKKLAIRLKVNRSTSPYPVDFDPETDLLLPGETAEKIIAGKLTGTILLKDTEVLSRDPYDNEFLVADPRTFNQLKIARAAQLYGLAVADLYSLYEKILEGSYYTHDGVKVDPTWPAGNFFSSDGLYPTALGQAIIANECILAINRYYGLSIPMISTKDLENAR